MGHLHGLRRDTLGLSHHRRAGFGRYHRPHRPARHPTPSTPQKNPNPPTPPTSPAPNATAPPCSRRPDEWVEEWLERDLYHEARLELQLTERHGAVELRVRHYTRGPDGPGREFPRDTPIEQVFDDATGQLLVLGEPGSGKSTKLVELARALIDRAQNDPSHPIPVILNLSTWTKKRAALDEWIRDELVRLYGVSPEQAKQWIGNDELLPLLDGLDEVARGERAACVTAINTYRQAHSLHPLAVCCRREEYDALPVPLDVANAIEVDTLAPEDVERYLDAQGGKLERVRRALDEDAELWPLMDTPLMLTVLFLASAAETDGEAPGATREPDARRRLYGRYVKAMFERPRKRRFPPEKALRWLGWLAAQLRNRNQIPFALEDLDPGWLPSRRAQHAVKWLGGLVGGLGGGLVVGLVGGLVGSLVGWLETIDMRPVDALRIDRERLPGALVVGLVVGLVGGLVGYLVVGLGRASRQAGWLASRRAGRRAGLRAGQDPQAGARERTQRGQRGNPPLIALRALHRLGGLVFSLVLTWGVDAFGGRLDAAELGIADALLLVAPLTACCGVLLGLHKGGYFALHHWVMRALLRRLNLAPWAYVSLLDEAKDHLFLRKTGGVYQFFHVTFREFMAETYGADWLAEPPPPDPATDAS